MRRLILLRHAKTETDAPSGRDLDRKLDPRGKSDAEQIGHWLAQHEQPPQRVLVSPAARTRQTWDIVRLALPDVGDVVEVKSLYSATPGELMCAISDHGGTATSLMLVAHNPGLHELAIGMTDSGAPDARRALSNNLPTAGLVTLDFDTDRWDEAGFRRGHLVGLVSPAMLRNAEREGQ